MNDFWEGFTKRAEDYTDPTGQQRIYTGQTDVEKREFEDAVNRAVAKFEKGTKG